MSDDKEYWGVIDEDGFQIRSPRTIDSDEYTSVNKAFAAALEMMEMGVCEMSIVRCRYSKKLESWVEKVDGMCIQINATSYVEAMEREQAAEDAESPAEMAAKAVDSGACGNYQAMGCDHDQYGEKVDPKSCYVCGMKQKDHKPSEKANEVTG